MKLTDYMAGFIAEKTDHVFVGNGGCVVHILDSLSNKENMNLVPFVNEQGSSIAAEVHHRVTGNPGVAIATSGPGIVNMLQGIACAYYDSIPAIYISGQVVTGHLKEGRKVRQVGFQEMPVTEMVDSFTKYAVCLTSANDVRYVMERLWWEAQNGRPGPVLLDLPDDIQRAEINPDELRSFIPSEEGIDTVLSAEVVEGIKKAIREAKRPLIVAGSGIKLSGTEEEAVQFIEKTGIPVVTTWSTIDMFTSDTELLVGNFGVSANRPGNFAVQTCDLLISLGSRLDTHMTGANASTFAASAYKIIVDIDSSEIEKENGLVTDLAVNMDLRKFFKQVTDELPTVEHIGGWRKRIVEWRRKYPICAPEYYRQESKVNPYVFMDLLSKLTKQDDIIITDAGGTLTWTMQGYEPKSKQKLFSAFNHSPMGYAFPAALGAKIIDPKSEVICITGDGGFNMNLQELGTLEIQKLPLKIFILNNKEYGIIKQTQSTWLDSRYVCSDRESGVSSPDFVKIAKGYGIKCESISRHDELEDKIKAVLSYQEGPIICDVAILENQEILPKLSFGRPLEDMYPHLSKEELEQNMSFK
ncbi:MAG: thiamine pyrophosphate-binding protein [Candidatus Marinimicrobia bacterium]|nr:thiamine pyrophosphate-binding protein [Gammaproteobacteria bacterium]MBT4605565.1 thiamine pyrophosphate-binding protein [Thiotrichales bacterium]MBT4948047.1 thiamine pyrophosphate-binding protein [Candidatus Neomarinimicrobiota bacterium]MBT5371326.1 thiamine pyrophosphate-binding protein [Gammaproteobacteria bacterium]MBT6217723.1 thiamine pyrophosphate-binding protein [Candidatus Neomarinimicrobiota bacterium]